MKIFRGKYNWQTTAHGREINGEEIKCWFDISFVRESEPVGESLDGKLIFRSDDGTEREAFFSSYRKNDGTIIPKMVLKKPVDVVAKTSMNVYTGDIPTAIDGEVYPW